MDARFQKFIPTVLKHEGWDKFTLDPDDPGGATKWGISLLFLKDVGDLNKDGWRDGDINRDGVVNWLDIKGMTQEQAEALYYSHFYVGEAWPRITSDALAFKCFDIGVNIGPGRTAKILAQALMEIGESSVADYRLDDNELAGINNYPNLLYPEFIWRMEDFYKSRNKPKYLNGWLNRLKDNPFL